MYIYMYTCIYLYLYLYIYIHMPPCLDMIVCFFKPPVFPCNILVV